jgi:SMODS and SLOG-associating 2TM effector domain family 4
MNQETGREYILATARELYGRAVYSHKTHEKEREIWTGKARVMNWINIGLASLTTLLAVVSIELKSSESTIVTALMASATTAFVLWQSSFDPVGKENQQRTTAKELLRIREQLLFLIERCHLELEHDRELQASLETITRELCALYKFSPDTSPKAYAMASSALKQGEFTFSDGEIDRFLPTKLRKKREQS